MKLASTRRQSAAFLAAILIAVLAAMAGLFTAGPASAATPSAAQDAVGAFASTVAVAVGPLEDVAAGQRWAKAPSRAVSVVGRGVAAETAGGGARSVVTSTDVVTSPSAMEGLTASQVDDLARNAGYEVLSGKAGAANPATRYYAPGTNRSVGFRVLPEGVAGQSGLKAGPYLRFFGGPNAGQRIPLGAS